MSLTEPLPFSRQAIKKYVQSNNKINVTSQSVFDSQFNKAIKAGVEKNEFTQPKGKFDAPGLCAWNLFCFEPFSIATRTRLG